MEIAYSVNRVPIRLTDERWGHIVNSHDDLASRVARPERMRRAWSPCKLPTPFACAQGVPPGRKINRRRIVWPRWRKRISGKLSLAQQVGRFPTGKLWLDYDAEADVLYVSLKRPHKATETIDLDEEGVLLRYRGNQLVGMTVLDASKRW